MKEVVSEVNNAGPKLREPVIGDAFDLETYGRPSAMTAARRQESKPARSRSDKSRADMAAARAMRVNSHRPTTVSEARAEKSTYDSEGRRTVRISGQPTPARRRAAAQIERYDAHPDRAAQWALFLGVFMVVVAIVTGT